MVLLLFGPPAVVLLAVGTLSAASFVLWCVPVLALFAAGFMILSRAQVRSLGYAERADDLLLRSGVLVRRIVVVPYGRMQFVDVQAGPLARKLGYATVQLHTASPGTDARLPGLLTAEAARLRDQLTARGQASLAGL